MLIADSEEKLQNILTTVTNERENKALQLNAKKTDCMVILKQSDFHVCKILCRGERVKQVGIFKYLGFTITADSKYDTEIKKTIALYKYIFITMKSIFTNRNSIICPLKAYIWSILVHGCECWTLAKDLERRLEAAEMWCIRRRMKIPWTEKEVKRRSNGINRIQKIPTQKHQKKTITIFGRIKRADGLEKQIFSGKICGTKSR